MHTVISSPLRDGLGERPSMMRFEEMLMVGDLSTLDFDGIESGRAALICLNYQSLKNGCQTGTYTII
jgi:hypothetical protein